jgi:hypothetical protein
MASNKQTKQRIEALHSGDIKSRKEAALWLGRKDASEVLAPLLAALHDSSWKVRRNAAVSLGKLRDLEAVEPLIAGLSDRTLSVKRAVVHALGTLRDARAVSSLFGLLGDAKLGGDVLKALVQIGAPALLHCCRKMQNDTAETLVLRQTTLQQSVSQGGDPRLQDITRQIVLRGGDSLLKEVLSLEGWNGQERWRALAMVRTVQASLPFLELWRLTRFSRISDIPNWCERITRDREHAALNPGCRQVLNYIMLGRASQRDFATESEELLRGASGTKERDTGATLLRASDKSDPTPETPSLLGRLRRWLRQEG